MKNYFSISYQLLTPAYLYEAYVYEAYGMSIRLNPLAANVLHVRHLAGPPCRRRSAFHRQNHEKRPF